MFASRIIIDSSLLVQQTTTTSSRIGGGSTYSSSIIVYDLARVWESYADNMPTVCGRHFQQIGHQQGVVANPARVVS